MKHEYHRVICSLNREKKFPTCFITASDTETHTKNRIVPFETINSVLIDDQGMKNTQGFVEIQINIINK